MTHPLTPREMIELKPCPFCGGAAEIERFGNTRVSTIYGCDECGCHLETGEEFNHGRVWNRRTDHIGEPAGMVSDHAELAAKAERCTTGDPWYKDEDLRGRQSFGQFLPQDRAFIAAANPATVLALLAEIAALRAERDGMIEEVSRSQARLHAATEAERKLAEAVEIASKLSAAISWLDYPFIDNNTSEDELRSRVGFMMKDAEQPRAMLSKEAERG